VLVVLTVSVEVPAVVPVTLVEVGFREQVGRLVAPAGVAVTAHARPTLPAKPPDEVAVIVELPETPAGEMLIAAPFSVKLGATTVRLSVCTRVPAEFLPVIRTLYVPDPIAAVVLTVSVVDP
jgi:hypothetical protein